MGVDAQRDAGQRFARRPRSAVRICGGSEPPLVSHSTTRSAPGVGGGAQAVERVAGVEREAVEEVLGVEQHALARADQERDRVGDHRRFSSRETRTTFSTCSTEALPTSVQTGAKQSASTRSPSSSSARDVAPAGHPERDDLGDLQLLVGEQLEQLLLLGVGRRESPASIMCTPSASSAWTTRSFSCGGEAQAAAAHAVAQGGVV